MNVRSDLGPRMVDAALAVAVVAGLSVVMWSDQGTARPLPAVAYLWAVGFGALMLFRRELPLLVLVLTVVGFFSYYAAGFSAIGVAVPIAAAVFSAAEMGHVRAAVVAALAVVLLSTAYRLVTGQSAAYVVGYELLGHVVLLSSVIMLGHSLTVRRDLVRRREALAQLVAQQVAADADLRAREHRLTIARDLHDSIGHSLAVASLYTSVAQESAPHDRARAMAALEQARSAISESMGHLRSTVALLRANLHEVDTAHPPDPSERIADVLEAPRSAGYDVRTQLSCGALPPDVADTVVRVVQESVTNVLKHSTGSRLEIHLREDDDGLLVLVSDDGTPPPVDRLPGGHGLAGMRERVEQLGGTLNVHSGPDGWTVRSTIPVRSS